MIFLFIVQNILVILFYWTPKSLISYYLSNYYPGVVYRLNTNGRKIMLTIDDDKISNFPFRTLRETFEEFFKVRDDRKGTNEQVFVLTLVCFLLAQVLKNSPKIFLSL